MPKIEIIDEENLTNNLTSIANALRTKNNIVNSLNFPLNYISEINNLYIATDWLDLNKPVGNLYVSGQLFDYILQGRTKITKLFAPNTTYIGANSLSSCKGLIYIVCPKCGTLYTAAVLSCPNLITVDLGGIPASAYGFCRDNSFHSCSKLKTLILRANTVWPLSNLNVFTNTPFASGKTGGTLYVPRAQIENYKNATNWSTILGYTKSDGETLQNKILPIEDSIYQAQYGDGTPLPGAFVSSTGKAYMPSMRIDIGGKEVPNALNLYGNMENLEELTLIGSAAAHTTGALIGESALFSNTRYPKLKKLYIQPTQFKNLGFNINHYVFTGTNLTELTLGKQDGPYFTNGGYFRRNDMPCPPGTDRYQVGSLDGLTITIYTYTSNKYANVAGFINSTLAPNTTLICRDYLTGEIFTP